MLGFGITGLGLDREADILQAFLRMQGSGYTAVAGSARVEELSAWAYAFAATFAALDAATVNQFPSTANELIAEWEAVARAPSAGGTDIQARQERLAAFWKITNARRDILQTALAEMGHTATYETTTRASRESANATPESIFQSSIALTTWDESARRIIRWLAQQAMPVMAYGSTDRAFADENMSDGVVAQWNATQSRFGRARIMAASPWTQDRAPSRLRDFCHLATLKHRDVAAIQHGMLLGASQLASVTYGRSRSRFFSVQVANGATVEVAPADADFLKSITRFVAIASTADRRPGQPGDTALNSGTVVAKVTYTGPGGVGYDIQIGGATLRMYVDAGTQAFMLNNTTGATRWVVGWFETSGDVTAPASTDEKPAISTGDDLTAKTFIASAFDALWWTKMRDGLAARPAGGAAADAWTGFPNAGYGGTVRICSLGSSTRPASGAVMHVLDGNMDWRDRLIVVQMVSAAGSHAFLGGPNDAQVNDSIVGFGFTGTGVTERQAAVQNYHIPIGASLRIGVSANDEQGALIVEHFTGAAAQYIGATFLIIASDQLGKRSAAAARTVPTAPANLSNLEAHQLNWLQDIAMATQGRSSDLATGAVESVPPWIGAFVGGPVSPTVLSLGPTARGGPGPRAQARWRRSHGNGSDWLLRRAFDVGVFGPQYRDVPQFVGGRVRRVFAFSIGGTQTKTVDVTVDWRDRVIFSMVAVSTSDITPGGASDALVDDNGGIAAFYTGAGSRDSLELRAATNIFWTVDSAGALRLKNNSASNYFLTGWVEASFVCGPRSTT